MAMWKGWITFQKKTRSFRYPHLNLPYPQAQIGGINPRPFLQKPYILQESRKYEEG